VDQASLPETKRTALRIAVLAHNLRVAGGLSVGRNVVAALRRVADNHNYLLFLPASVGYEALDKPTRAVCHYYRRTRGSTGQWLYERITMPRLVGRFRPDVIWGLGNFGLRNPGTKQAFLFHKPHFIYDRHHTRAEPLAQRFRNHLARRRLKNSLQFTQLVFCQTKTAAARFRRYLGYQGPIALMPNAVSRFTDAGPPTMPPAVFERLKGKYVLFCLTKYYAHKNLEMLVEVFRRHAAELEDIVVLVTVQADQHPRAAAFIDSLYDPAVRGQIVNVGPVGQHELAAYYTHSDGLILPTLLESFTGTYLEAMQFKRPILTSDLDFAREVCGDAALYFDPWDARSIRDAILKLRNEPELANQLVVKGAARIDGMFKSWDEIVTEAVEALSQLVKADGGTAEHSRSRRDSEGHNV
jgi:glycosyltransferase involved in cell wall biosynthesis